MKLVLERLLVASVVLQGQNNVREMKPSIAWIELNATSSGGTTATES